MKQYKLYFRFVYSLILLFLTLINKNNGAGVFNTKDVTNDYLSLRYNENYQSYGGCLRRSYIKIQVLPDSNTTIPIPYTHGNISKLSDELFLLDFSVMLRAGETLNNLEFYDSDDQIFRLDGIVNFTCIEAPRNINVNILGDGHIHSDRVYKGYSGIVLRNPNYTEPPILPTNTPSTCKGNPLCGGPKKGECKGTNCLCFLPYFGEDCTSKVAVTTPIVNSTKPQVDIPYDKFSSLISIYSLREKDFDGKVVNEYILSNYNWSYIESTSASNFKFSTNITNKNDNISKTNLIVFIQRFENITVIQFANQNITMLPSTMKYYINLSSYNFSSSLNTLDLVMFVSIENKENVENSCSDNLFGESSSQSSSQFIKIQIDQISLYGEFIKRAIVDKRIVGISNTLLKNDKNLELQNSVSVSQSFIAIEIPHYADQVELDPNFSVLVEANKPSSDNSICNKSSGLTNSQKIGIIIGSVGLFVVLVIIVGAIIYKKSTVLRVQIRALKLKKIVKK